MPIYNFECLKCGNKKIDEVVLSQDKFPTCCGKQMSKQNVYQIHPGFPKGGLTLYNVEEKPVHFDTKNQLRKYKREHNLELGALPND